MKMFAFCGLEHHYLKLSHIVDVLRARNHDVQWLTSNNAINIDPPAAYLTKRGESFVHLYDYLSDSISINNLVTEHIFHVANRETWGRFPPFWQAYSLREMAEVYVAVLGLIVDEKPDAFLILHENNFWGRIIALVARLYDIPCFSFQEGILRESDQTKWNKQGLAADNSTVLFCWSAFAKWAYIEAGIPEEKLFVSGPAHLDEYVNLVDNRSAMMLALSLTSHWKGDLVADVRLFAEYCNNNGIAPIVRFHPREMQRAEAILGDIVNMVHLDNNPDPLPMLVLSKALLTQHSTIGLEAIGLKIPVVEYAPTANGLIVEQGWHTHYGIAPQISSASEMDAILSGIIYDDTVLREWRESRIPVDGMAAERIAVVIERELK